MLTVLLNIQLIFIILSFIIIGYILIIFYRVFKLPKSFPSKFIKKQRVKNPSRKRIIFVGDSFTHGTVGHSYIEILKKKLGTKDFEFINAGLNGDLTINILKRIDDIIRCEPDILTVLIGTNDAMGSYTVEARRKYVKTKGAKDNDDFWTLKRFREDFTEIIKKFKYETKAKIGVLSLPILGEDPLDPIFEQSKSYSEVIKEVSMNFEVHYIPLNEYMTDYLRQKPSNQKYKYDKKFRLMVVGILAHYFGKNWQKIAKKNGIQLLVDFVHLSPRGASIISYFIEKFIESNIV